jgi:hypothetical protein
MLIFCDSEVFAHDWLFVFVIPETREYTVIHNNRDELIEFYEAHKKDIYVAYNLKGYDQYIFKAILLDMDVKAVNDFMIGGNWGWQYSRAFQKVKLLIYDAIFRRGGSPVSLKELECHMGHNIKESSVPFDIDRPLTEAELKESIEYCTYDVRELIEVFMLTKSSFDSQIGLINTFALPLSCMSKTKAQLAAVILDAYKKDYDDEFELRLPDTLRIEKYTEVLDWYKNPDNMDYKKSLKLDVAGVKHLFAWGGLHGALERYNVEGEILSIDVSSYYPALMIEYDYLSRNVLDPTKYRSMRDERMKLKRAKDKKEAFYKILINGTFGASKDKYNNLFDPLQANNICVAGQLLLLDLIEKLESYWKLIQSNTDGLIGLIPNETAKKHILKICKEWEQRTRMQLDYKYYSRIYQKDVNNYIIIDSEGNYKSKGAQVKTPSDLDNDLPIVNKALINFFLHNIPVEMTIKNCNKLIDFQKIVKISAKYGHITIDGEKINEKCLRVFAAKKGQSIKKVKLVYKDDKELESHQKISYVPECCIIDNGNIIDKLIPPELDKNWYVELAKNRIKDWVK